MKLFLKEQSTLIMVQVIQFTTIAGIFWLSGYRDISIMFYSIFLSCFLLLCYLAYSYTTRRKFYDRLSKPIETMDESLQRLDNVTLSEHLNKLLMSQYNLYQQEIMTLHKKQDEHLMFIDRWIHQMKTPISVLELMAKELDEPDASSFREEIDRLKTGLNMVLYMARIRMIEQDLHIKQVSLLKVVQEVNQENRRLFIRNKVYPQIKEHVNDLVVETDEKWLFFILTQLIQNAVKYSTGHASKIEIILDKRNGRAVLEVRDEGVGIPKEDIKRIFDAFYTGANGRQFRESTGIGLFLVKEVVQYLGHTIEVESVVHQGTIFRVNF